MITNIALTFTNNNTIVLTNNSGSNIILTFFKCKKDSTWIQYSDITVPANGQYTASLLDGAYRLTGGANSIVFLIYGNILNHLKIDIADIVLDQQPLQPAKYDFISLVLLGITFIGNTAYQNVTYTATPTELADFAKIAEAIDIANKYADHNDNTPQSNNKLWM